MSPKRHRCTLGQLVTAAALLLALGVLPAAAVQAEANLGPVTSTLSPAPPSPIPLPGESELFDTVLLPLGALPALAWLASPTERPAPHRAWLDRLSAGHPRRIDRPPTV